MSDREIIECLAMKVMGWGCVACRSGKGYDVGDKYPCLAIFTHRNGKVSTALWVNDKQTRTDKRWNPLESITDAMGVVANIREIIPIQKTTQTYSFQLNQTGIPGEWTCSFVVNEGDFRTQARAVAYTAPRAICLAAYEVVK